MYKNFNLRTPTPLPSLPYYQLFKPFARHYSTDYKPFVNKIISQKKINARLKDSSVIGLSGVMEQVKYEKEGFHPSHTMKLVN